MNFLTYYPITKITKRIPTNMWVFLYIITIYIETFIMKFIDLLEDLLNEGKNFTDDKFDKFANNAGMWLFELFIDNISKVATMPGYLEYKNYVINNSNYSAKELSNLDNLVMTLPDYYKYFINEIDYKLSNRIMGKTISMFNLADKMSGRDNSTPMKRGRKPKSQATEPQADDAMTHFDQAVEKRRGGARPGAGRKRLPDELKKRYIPTGLPRGRRPKVRDAEPELAIEPINEPIAEPTAEPVMKQRGGARPGAGRPNISKFEPKMVDTRIKTLEDRIASLEALLREKGMLQENRALLESRLRMMKDYRKFL